MESAAAFRDVENAEEVSGEGVEFEAGGHGWVVVGEVRHVQGEGLTVED